MHVRVKVDAIHGIQYTGSLTRHAWLEDRDIWERSGSRSAGEMSFRQGYGRKKWAYDEHGMMGWMDRVGSRTVPVWQGRE